MSHRISPSTFQRGKISANNHAVERRLSAAQNEGAALLYAWEDISPEFKATKSLYPVDTWRDLEHNRSYCDQGTALDLSTGEQALFSTSPLPSRELEKTIEPFVVSYDGDALSYMFIVNGNKSDTSRVVRVFPGNGNTQDDRFYKQLWVEQPTHNKQIDTIYEPHTRKAVWDVLYKDNPNQEPPITIEMMDKRGKDDWLRRISADPSLSQTQLDAVQDVYRAKPGEQIDYAEAVALLDSRHLGAIVVPVLRHPAPETEVLYKATRELNGALAGIAHEKHGHFAPVVTYNVNTAPLGRLTCIACTPEECRELAQDALRRMRKHSHAPGANPEFIERLEVAASDLGIEAKPSLRTGRSR